MTDVMDKELVIGLLAMDEGKGIGANGSLPWGHNKLDMRLFRALTEGENVIMGRKTWESLPIKPLPERLNIILSNSIDTEGEGYYTISNHGGDSPYLPSNGSLTYIIGGMGAIEHYSPEINVFIISKIEGVYDCDVKFDPTLLKDFQQVKLGIRPLCKKAAECDLSIGLFIRNSLMESEEATETIKEFIESTIEYVINKECEDGNE